MEDPKRLGERLREVREAKNLKIAEVARRAGVSSPYWSQVENAKRHPRVPDVRAFAWALRTDPVELLELAGYDEAAAEDRRGDLHWAELLAVLDPSTAGRIRLTALSAVRLALEAPPTAEMADPDTLERLREAARRYLESAEQ